MLHRAFVIFLTGLCWVPSSIGREEMADSKAAVQNFYTTVLTFKQGGVPSPHDLSRLSPFISLAFADRLLKARQAEVLYARKTKGESPPLVEGMLFFSLFEGANRYTKITREPAEKPVSFLVDLEYTDPGDELHSVHWHDRAILIQENHKWVVDDLELLGDWQFGAKGKLSDILRNVVKEANEPVAP